MKFAPELEQFIGRRVARRKVVEAIASAPHAFSIDALHRVLRTRSPEVSRSTIYRTVRIMRSTGLVREAVLKGGVRVYQLVTDHRTLTWICDDCGNIRNSSLADFAGSLSESARSVGFLPGEMSAEIHFRCSFRIRGDSCPLQDSAVKGSWPS